MSFILTIFVLGSAWGNCQVKAVNLEPLPNTFSRYQINQGI